MLRTFLLILGVLLWVPLPILGSALFASSGTQGEWLSGCQAGRTTTAVQRNHFACWNPLAGVANGAPRILDTNACENYDVLIYDDVAGDGTVTAAVWDLYHCPAADTDYSAYTAALNGCTQFDVGSPVSGFGSVLGAASSWFWMHNSGTNPSGDPRVIVRCNGAR